LPHYSRPHLSAALAHLRLSVMACALVLGFAIVGQVGMWAVVHFTELRESEVEAVSVEESVQVVNSPPRAQVEGKPKDASHVSLPPSRAEVNKVPGEQDIVMRRFSMLVQGGGVLASILLAILMFQGVMLAGASGVPGVERAVSASTMAFIIAMVAVPLHRVLPELQFQGLFVNYDRLVEESNIIRAGVSGPRALSFYVEHLLLPGALLVALIAVVVRFRSGVEAGVIVTSVSQLDEKLEREIRGMRTGQLAQPRAMGALNLAIGAQPMDVPMRQAAGGEVVRAAPPAFRAAVDSGGIPINPGDSTKRPI
jgi:hypothetical protein